MRSILCFFRLTSFQKFTSSRLLHQCTIYLNQRLSQWINIMMKCLTRHGCQPTEAGLLNICLTTCTDCATRTDLSHNSWIIVYRTCRINIFQSTDHIILFKLLTKFAGHTTGRVLYRYLVRMALKGKLIPV